MELFINGEKKHFDKPMSIAQIIDSLGIESKIVAIALNSLVVKKEDRENVFPEEGDKIEFLQFMGGG